MRLCCTTLALLAALAAGADAQTPDGRTTWLELQAASITHDRDFDLKNTSGVGLAGGQWLTSHWGWEASLLRDPVKDRAGDWQSMEVHCLGSALFDPLPNPHRWRPFLRLGLGVSGGVFEPPLTGPGTTPGLGLSAAQLDTANTPSTTTRLSLVAGVGLQAWLGGHAVASVEARQLRVSVTAATGLVENQMLVGLGYRWRTGGIAPLPETAAPTPEEVPEVPHPRAREEAPRPLEAPEYEPRPASEPLVFAPPPAMPRRAEGAGRTPRDAQRHASSQRSKKPRRRSAHRKQTGAIDS